MNELMMGRRLAGMLVTWISAVALATPLAAEPFSLEAPIGDPQTVASALALQPNSCDQAIVPAELAGLLQNVVRQTKADVFTLNGPVPLINAARQPVADLTLGDRAVNAPGSAAAPLPDAADALEAPVADATAAPVDSSSVIESLEALRTLPAGWSGPDLGSDDTPALSPYERGHLVQIPEPAGMHLLAALLLLRRRD